MRRRFDGRPVGRVHAYRRLMPYLMRGKNESAVYFEQSIELTQALGWIDGFNARSAQRITVFHLVLAAIAKTLHERPRLNRFVAGRSLYERNGVYLSFAAKKNLDDDAPLATVKREFPVGESFTEMVAALANGIDDARSNRASSVDKEIGLLLRLPSFVLDRAIGLVRKLDAASLAPRALLDHDPLFTSAFVANLGSLQIDAAYHHLYEYGNCPLFVTVGKIERVPMVSEDGTSIEIRPRVLLRITFDERIEDGFYAARSLELMKNYIAAPATYLSPAAPTPGTRSPGSTGRV